MKNTFNYRKITELVADKLSPAEAYTYLCLASKSDYNTMVSSINQDTLAMIVDGTKDAEDEKKVSNRVRTIQNHLAKFAEHRLIETWTQQRRGPRGAYRFNTYHLTDEHYCLIDMKLIDEPISKELKGFLVMLKLRCFNGTNTCQYSYQQLADTLTISKSTVGRYMKEAMTLGYVKKDSKGIHLTRKDIFYITSETMLAFMKRVYPEVLTDEDLYYSKI